MVAIFLWSDLSTSGITSLSTFFAAITFRSLLLSQALDPSCRNAMCIIVVLLAHASQDSLLSAWFPPILPGVGAYLLLGAVRDAPAALHAYLATARHLTALTRRTMGGAEPCLFDVLSASWSRAYLALGTMSDAQAPLNNAVGAGGEGALAASRFAFELRILVMGEGGGADCLRGNRVQR